MKKTYKFVETYILTIDVSEEENNDTIIELLSKEAAYGDIQEQEAWEICPISKKEGRLF